VKKVKYYLTIFFFSLSLMSPVFVYDPMIDYYKYREHYSWMKPSYFIAIYNASKVHNVSVDEICAVIQSESEGDPTAISIANARGLMQVIGKHHYRGDPRDLYDPALNVYLGTKYFRECKMFAKGNMVRALMAYNAGPGCKPENYPKILKEKYINVIIKNSEITRKLPNKHYIIQ